MHALIEFALRRRQLPLAAGLLVLVTMFVLALPVASSGQTPIASTTVCQVTGSASAPTYLEVQVAVEQVAAYLNQFPGSFVGSCPSSGGGGGGGSTPPITSAVTVCQVTGSASAPSYLEVQVAADQVAAYLNQFPGSFAGSCPASGGGGGGGGGSTPPITSAVTVCQVTGSANALSYLEVQVAVDQVAAYLNQFPGSFAGSCPASGGGGGGGTGGGTLPPSGGVTVCRVSGSVNAPNLVQLSLNVDQVVAFLNQNPGSFIGTCPGQGGTVTQGPGRILGIPVGAAVTICQVTSNAKALRFLEVNVAIDRVAAFLNQNPGSFVGLCPSSSDPNGTLGNEPLGYVTICRVTGDVNNPLAPITIRRNELSAYLTRAGTIVPGPTGGCPSAQSTAAGAGGNGGSGGSGSGGGGADEPSAASSSGGGGTPSTTQIGRAITVVVQTTPNTVVTANGAGVKAAGRSNKSGKATLKVKPKRPGIVLVRAAGNKVVKSIGVVASARSGGNLTG